MSQYLNNKRKSEIKKLYFLVGSMLMISYDTYWFGTSGVKLVELIRDLFVVGLPLWIYMARPHIQISKTNSIILFYLVSVIVLSSIINSNTISAPLLMLSGVFMAMYLLTKYSFYDIAKCFSNIIIIISIYSCVIYIAVILKAIPLKTVTNIADSFVLTAYGCQFYSELGEMVLRNSSIFREPGVYMIMLNFAIIFQLFVVKENRMWCNVIILIISLITSLSTGGFICLALILIIYFVNTIKGIGTIAMISVTISALILPAIGEEYIDLVFYSKFNEIETSGSGFARMSSFFIPLNIFLKYPLLGCGFDQFKLEYVQMGQELYNRYINPQGMSTNTVMNIFAIWGIFVGIFFVYGFYRLAKLITIGRNVANSLLMVLCLFMIFSNESMPYWPFIYIFMLYGISAKNLCEIPLKHYEQKSINHFPCVQSRRCNHDAESVF